MELDFKQYKKENCRYCNNKLPETGLALGTMPLANSFLNKDDLKNNNEFICPLSIVRCNNCSLVQLSYIVPADLMFSHYLYVTSTTATFREHFAMYARDLNERVLNKDKRVAVDIGSNDGLLVASFIAEGFTGAGVEPAKNLATTANQNGTPTINRYFDHEAVQLIKDQYGKADVISANNVFAHIDDISSVCENVYDLLNTDGIFVIEFPYLVTMYDKMYFDMIYHEHLSYISVAPLSYMLGRFDLEIFDVKEVDSHGGSLRVYSQKIGGRNEKMDTVEKYLNNEEQKGYNSLHNYNQFSSDVQEVKRKLNDFVNSIKKDGKSISGYGAPAKGNTIINFCEFTSDQIEFIVDDNPLKQNMFAPGSQIPIVSGAFLEQNPTDYVIIFAWNFAKEILCKLENLKHKGIKFIVPLPNPTIIAS